MTKMPLGNFLKAFLFWLKFIDIIRVVKNYISKRKGKIDRQRLPPTSKKGVLVLEKKNLSLKKLYDDTVLFTKVVNLMNQNKSYTEVIEFVQSKGKNISKQTLSNLNKKLKIAKQEGVSLSSVMDRRNKSSIADLNKAGKLEGFGQDNEQKDNLKSKSNLSDALGSSEYSSKSTETIKVGDNDIAPSIDRKVHWSTAQVLDDMIDQYYYKVSMGTNDKDDDKTGLKAIELKEKYHAGSSGGLSLQAIQQYRILNESMLKAMYSAMFAYVPEQYQEECEKEMEKQANEILSNIEVSADGSQLLTALRDAGADNV